MPRKDPEARREYMRNWYARNADRRRAYGREQDRKHSVRRRYGISREEYDELLTQPCSICGKESEVLDHDHATGAIRGPLCHRCNLGLSHYADKPQLLRAAAEYLERQ